MTDGVVQSCCPTVAGSSGNAQSCCAPAIQQAASEVLSAVDFPNTQRPHISLNVRNVQRSVPFYRVLFDQNPTKLRSDYAKFEPVDPPINFTLNEHEDAVDRDGHFGIEVKDAEAVGRYLKRFKVAGLKVDTTETQVACCYSIQDKAWVVDPDGNHWEIFVVTDNEAAEGCGLSCICYDPSTGGCNWKAKP
ncbi:VOC family protein [Aquabacterium sp. A7-Y]|uniref:ArsI/CadI family heavy metal resistance metalloenzyme n=1 Tax=Aquabacterium sp. A7-Y TaxID=1349605 RepID=UPI00223D0956|nr:ArsI/CadI family heavy metal resistance metalloenzyme [Aquabacterium sp. A7-Y]MCW7540994.1 VOC family protein [Aquabacterium sp. A7-Y]